MAAPTLKSIRGLYQSRNGLLSLSNVKLQLYVEGVAKSVGASAIALTELDSTNSPGVYEYFISSAALTTAGVVPGQVVELVINSATQLAQSIVKERAVAYLTDDLGALIGLSTTGTITSDIAAVQTKLGTPAGASVSADLAAIKADSAAVKADLETGSASLQTILTNIQSLQNASIGNGVGFVLPTMIIPSTGSNTYKIPITIQNDNGALVDPVGQTITVGVTNAAGTDRGAFLSGSTGSPANVTATRSSTGQYYVTVQIPSTEIEEELIFSFAYTIGANPMVRFGVSQTIADTATAGYALQATLLATQTTVNTINSAIANATYGLSALQALLTSGTSGLAVIAGLLNNGTNGLVAINNNVSSVGTAVAAANSTLNNATYGLAALQTQGAATQGAGFVPGTDDLHSLSLFLRTTVYTGGKAV